MINFTKSLILTLLSLAITLGQSQYNYDYQYQEADRNYGGRRQDVLRGQFVEVAQQQEADAEYVDDPVPVVIRGLQMAEDDDIGSSSENKPAFSFDNDTTMNLDGPGYALSLLLIGEIVILAMAFFAGGLGFGGRSFSSSGLLGSWLFPGFGEPTFASDLGHGYDRQASQGTVPWSAALNSLADWDLGSWTGGSSQH